MEIVFGIIKLFMLVIGFFAYLICCAIAIWVMNYKKTWQRILAGIGAFIFTPLIFVLVMLIVQETLKYIKNNWRK